MIDLLTHVVPDGAVDPVGDDTVDGHPGAKVYGKGRDRDAVRSRHAYTAWRYGHEWVVPAVPVRLPFATRRLALPILVDPYRTPEVGKAEGVRHRTPARVMCRLLRVMPIRFPDRAFVSAGDPGFGTHGVARFCHRHRARLALASECHPDVNPFAPPPPCRGNGRPHARAPGGGRRGPPAEARRGLVRGRDPAGRDGPGTGHWYEGGHGLVPIRWVYGKDATGTRRDVYPFVTDAAQTADAVVGTYRRTPHERAGRAAVRSGHGPTNRTSRAEFPTRLAVRTQRRPTPIQWTLTRRSQHSGMDGRWLLPLSEAIGEGDIRLPHRHRRQRIRHAGATGDDLGRPRPGQGSRAPPIHNANVTCYRDQVAVFHPSCHRPTTSTTSTGS